jgi:penicillin-binding protein 1A
MWAKRVWIAGITGIVFVLSTLYVLWAVQALPDPSQDVLAAGDVVVLDRNGRLIEDWNPAGHYHVNFHLGEMGKYAPAATLAAEDRNFYHHGAIDVGSTARALWVDVTHLGLNEGGSTITQQLVKIQLLTPTKSVTRKVHEMVLAIALEERFSKDQILTMYLNRVYYGHGAYGIGAASRTYFTQGPQRPHAGAGRIPRRAHTGAGGVRPRRPLRARAGARAVRARRHGDNWRPITGRGGHGV